MSKEMSSEISVADAVAELQGLTRCKCSPSYTDRNLHDPACNCDSAEAVQVVAAEIKRLRSSRRDMHRRAQSAEGRMTRITHYALGMVQRDKARKVMPRDGEAILRAARADSGSAFLLGWSVWEPELKAARGDIARLTRELEEAHTALRGLIERYDEVVTDPDCSCSQDDHAVQAARAALGEAG